MKSKLRFSIITISYNSEKVIGKTIKSVLEQDYLNYEYIFIDGGSEDNTNIIIDDYSEKLNDKGIMTKHISEQDKGISDAFNKGIAISDGEIIVILNSDDELCPGALRRIDKEMTKDVDIVYGNCVWRDEIKGISYIRRAKKKPSRLIHAMVLIHPSTFVRKEIYDRYGNFRLDYKYSMDRELLVRFLKAKAKFKYIDYEFTIMRAGGISDNNFWSVLKEGDQIPRMYGEPEIIIRLVGLEKYVKYKLSHIYRRIVKK